MGLLSFVLGVVGLAWRRCPLAAPAASSAACAPCVLAPHRASFPLAFILPQLLSYYFLVLGAGFTVGKRGSLFSCYSFSLQQSLWAWFSGTGLSQYFLLFFPTPAESALYAVGGSLLSNLRSSIPLRIPVLDPQSKSFSCFLPGGVGPLLLSIHPLEVIGWPLPPVVSGFLLFRKEGSWSLFGYSYLCHSGSQNFLICL